jgi:tRNA (mo5U34)-methyltransferase
MDLDSLGQFDVVLYLGVLYHMPEPFHSLERVRQVTKQVAAVETVGLNVPGRNQLRLLEFHAGNDLGNDFGNWYVPTTAALVELCRAAGFSLVEVIVGTPENPPAPLPASLPRRLLDALRPPPPGQPAPAGYFRTLVHAYV